MVHQLAYRYLLIGGVAPFSSLQARVRFFLTLRFLISPDLAVSVEGHSLPQGPDWRRLAILFSWYLAGIPTAYIMHDSCIVGAPGTWARGIRVFIEGVVAFGLGGFLYGLGRCLFPVHHSRPVLLPFLPEKAPSGPGVPKSGRAVESV